VGLRVLVAHNFYGDRAAGGEATVFEQETKLLRLNGCDVTTLERSNSEITRWPVWKKCALPFCLGNSREVYRQVVELIKEKRPEILHAHNYKYVLTPSIFKAAKDCGVKTVLTLHNYRLICPGGQLRRGNEICEECLRRSPSRILWRRGCASKMSTRILQSLLYFETKKNVLENVDVFVALTDFSKRKFVEGGFPSERIWVKPNFIFDPLEQIGEGRVKAVGDLSVYVDCRVAQTILNLAQVRTADADHVGEILLLDLLALSEETDVASDDASDGIGSIALHATNSTECDSKPCLIY